MEIKTSPHTMLIIIIVTVENSLSFITFPTSTIDSDLNASRNIAKRYMRNMSLGAVTHPHISSDDYEGFISN